MTLVTPELKLFIQETPGEPDLYILKSSAYFENENLVAAGHGSIPLSLNNDDELVVELFLLDDMSSNGSESSTVNHILILGSL